MRTTLYRTEVSRDGIDWRVEVYNGRLPHSPPVAEFDPHAISFDDKVLESMQTNCLGIPAAGTFNLSVNLYLLPNALKRFITQPQQSFSLSAEYNPSTLWIIYKKHIASVSDGTIVELALVDPGTGYSPGPVTGTGGHGTGASFIINTDSGAVILADVGAGGINYQVGDIITLYDGDRNATVQVTRISDPVESVAWRVRYIGTQYQSLEKDWKPFGKDAAFQIELTDLRTDILSQMSFAALQELLISTYYSIFADVKVRNYAVDYVINGSNTSMFTRPVPWQYSAQLYKVPGFMHFFPVYRLFDLISLEARRIEMNYYDSAYAHGCSLFTSLLSPLLIWKFFQASWSEDAHAHGSAIAHNNLYTCFFVTATNAAPSTSADILDGIFTGKSSLGERYKGKGVIEWLNKEYEAHFAKGMGFPHNDDNSALCTLEPAPLFSVQQPNDYAGTPSPTPVSIDVLLYAKRDELVVRKPDEFITSAKCIVSYAGEHFNTEFEYKILSSRRESSRDFEMTFHNLPSKKGGAIIDIVGNTGNRAAAMIIEAAPFGVLFYLGDDEASLFYGANDLDEMFWTTPGNALVRVSDYAYCVLDAGLYASSSGAKGHSGALIDYSHFTFEEGTVNARWDVVAALAHVFTMTQHLVLLAVKVFGDPQRVNVELD